MDETQRPELAERLAKFMWRRTLPSLGPWDNASKERKELMLHEAHTLLAWLATEMTSKTCADCARMVVSGMRCEACRHYSENA